MLNKDYLRLLLKDGKKLMPLRDVRTVNVPKFDELSVKNIFPKKMDDPRFMAYFPDKSPRGRWPNRTYFFNILNTLEPGQTEEMIRHANKLRNAVQEGEREDQNVVVTEEWWQALHKTPFVSGKFTILF
jgi:hypothetical protein